MVMQVYYEDLDNGDRSEAYCSLVHCYSLPDDGGLWVEHGYFDDRYRLDTDCSCTQAALLAHLYIPSPPFSI